MEKRLSLCKAEHEVSYVAITQRNIVADTASQQASNVDVEVYHNFARLGAAELLDVVRYLNLQSIGSLGASSLPCLEEIFVNLE